MDVNQPKAGAVADIDVELTVGTPIINSEQSKQTNVEEESSINKVNSTSQVNENTSIAEEAVNTSEGNEQQEQAPSTKEDVKPAEAAELHIEIKDDNLAGTEQLGVATEELKCIDCPLDASQAAAEEAKDKPIEAWKFKLMQAKIIFYILSSITGLISQIYLCITMSTQYMITAVVLMYIHVVVRSLMDWKYDCAAMGDKKLLGWAKLQCFNFLQLRLIKDRSETISDPNMFSMSLIMTKVVDCLCKRVPQGVLAIYAFYTLANDTESSFNDFAPSVFLVGYGMWGYSTTMRNFEISMNPAFEKRKHLIRVFFGCDYLLRVTVCGFMSYSVLMASDVNYPIVVIISTVLLIYLNRLGFFWYVFFDRGYVYPDQPAEEGKPIKSNNSRNTMYKFFFAFFPASFVQILTDFPFNGDLSSRRGLFRCFQTLSWLERLGVTRTS